MARRIFVLGSVVLAGFYALIFGELFLRAMDPQPLMPRYVVGTEWGIRGNEPNIRYRHWTPETEVELVINSHGMRDTREFDYVPAAGTCRIALLGDSYFMGYEASLEESIAGQLESIFEAAGYELEVLNFAVSGHGTSEMILHFEHLARRFSPDIAVFQFHGSDYNDNIRANLHRLTAEGKVIATGNSYLPAVGIRNMLEAIPAYRWMSEYSQVYAGLRERAAVLVKETLARANLRATAEAAAADDMSENLGNPYAEALTAALVAKTKDITESARIDWYLFDVPTRRSRTEFVSALARIELRSDLLDRTVSVLDKFRNKANEDVMLYFERGHLHFTPLGNRLAAESLFEAIRYGSADRLRKCPAAA